MPLPIPGLNRAEKGFMPSSRSQKSDPSKVILKQPPMPPSTQPAPLTKADVLAALRETADVDWFYLSPAASFGAYAPGEATGHYRLGGDVLLADADGNSNISGADYAKAFVDEIEQPEHRRKRFSVAY